MGKGYNELENMGIAAFFSIVNEPMDLQYAINNAFELIEISTQEIYKAISLWLENNMFKDKVDLVIIGAGIIGLATANEIIKTKKNIKILLVEKSSGVASQQSGHNSGVIHSGIYYKPGSFKA